MPFSDEPKSIDWLLAQVCHHHYARAQELLDKIGLYRGQPPLLHAVWEQEGITHTELAARLQNKPATISRMLHRLEKAGFILLQPDESDQRISRVFLTAAGRNVLAQIDVVHDQIQAETFSGLSAAELEQIQDYLTRMRDNLLHFKGE
ncbi:MAG: MarR family winged helix-turn-helix transcriptional regulator [Anaerolineae bacterium]